MHREYRHIVPGANKAILFVHGIVGTPNHFQSFVELVPAHISVYNMLLDGHGKGVRDFSRTSMEKWKTQVEKAVEELSANHKEVYAVAHSLGSLLAIEQAIQNNGITKLFLLAVPLRLFIKPRMVVNSLKVYFNVVKPTDAPAVAAKACYGIGGDKNPLHYIGWIPRFLELFGQIRKTRKIINSLQVPCEVYQSLQDEMVSKQSIKMLRSNPKITVTELPNSGHYYYEKNDFTALTTAFLAFISECDG